MITDEQLGHMARELCAVGGIRAVALGGSRAAGTHRPDSDVDLGLYYEGDIDRRALEKLAARYSGDTVAVTPPGGWGPWVDGGAWLRVDGIAVDWIVRDVRRVTEQCERACRGQFAFHAQPGHPLGFLDVAYAGEVATCVPLCDDEGLLAELAALVTPYPESLRRAILAELWQVDFLLDAAEKGAGGGDATYVALCISTAAMIVAHAWNAVAGRWVTNEKGLLPNLARLAIDCGNFGEVAASVSSTLGSGPVELQASIALLRHAPRPIGSPSAPSQAER